MNKTIKKNKRHEKIGIHRSILLRTLHQEGRISCPELCKRYPMHAERSIYRHATAKDPPIDKRKFNKGRPKKVTEREERLIKRTLLTLRQQRASFSAKHIHDSTNLRHLSINDIRRTLKKLGYSYRQSRKKGLLSAKDKTKRLQYAREMQGKPANFWKEEITFYFDGVGFAHRSNPYSEASCSSSMAWRKPGEGLAITTKGRKEGSGGKMANFFVGISYGSGVVCCHHHTWKITGERFGQFVTEEFPGTC